jgi:hypothetical protein
MDAELEQNRRRSFEGARLSTLPRASYDGQKTVARRRFADFRLCDCDEVLVRYSNAPWCDRPLQIAFPHVTYATYVRDGTKLGRFERVVIEF